MDALSGPAPETEAGIGSLTLGGLLAETTARHRDRQAIAFEGRAWTYGELEADARRVARALLAADAHKGTRVAVLMGNRPEWVAAAFGVALAGGVLVPVNTWFEPPELDYLLRHCDASVLLMQSRLLNRRYLDQLGELCPEMEPAEPGRLRAERWPFLRRVVCLGLHQ